jgi:GDP/UDP-N,N'-diacetylbacillosamine 2-epimerase (hydrolysing)
MSHRVCVVTGSRAEYGLLKHLMALVRESESLQLQLVATGSHLSPEFGMTAREIIADGFTIDRRVEMLLSGDTGVAVAKSVGLGMIGFADVLEELQPDILVVLGDRSELLSACGAALFLGIPIGHIHGGEATEGAVDDAIRHAVTKMAALHFVAAEPYARRVRQLGEDPDSVFVVGGLGVDALCRVALVDREEFTRHTGFEFGEENILVTFHPVTREAGAAHQQLQALLQALEERPRAHALITYPNADAEGRSLIPLLEEFAQRHGDRIWLIDNLGQKNYLSALSQFSAVVGNSSSGITEAPTVGIPTVNIGSRQAGRLRAASVIDCDPNSKAIAQALDRAHSPEFKVIAQRAANPYGSGYACEAIVKTLEDRLAKGVRGRKVFHDMELDRPLAESGRVPRP